MKRKIVNLVIAVNFLTIGWFLGQAAPNSYATEPDYVDMHQVTDFEATETGLMIYTADGTGYYWER